MATKKSEPKKAYFAKFSQLPFKYDYVKAVSFFQAKKHFEQYRDDVAVYDPLTNVMTFHDYHNQRYEKIDITRDEYKQYDKAKGSLFNGDKIELEINRHNHIEDLRRQFAHYPGAAKGNLFFKDGLWTFTVKQTKELIDYIVDNNFIKELTREQIKRQMDLHKFHFPLFIYTSHSIKKKTEPVAEIDFTYTSDNPYKY